MHKQRQPVFRRTAHEQSGTQRVAALFGVEELVCHVAAGPVGPLVVLEVKGRGEARYSGENEVDLRILDSWCWCAPISALRLR